MRQRNPSTGRRNYRTKMLIDVPIHLIYQKNLKILTNCHQRNVYNIFRSGVIASSQFIRDSNSNSMRKTYRNLK